MKRKKTIADDVMTIGVFAKKMGTTVRTLQYYDQEGMLIPSSQSEGGRRLYTPKDMIKLHQIQSLKSLGFSLNDIKNRLIPLDTPEDVVKALQEQSLAIQQKMQQLSEAYMSIEALKSEVCQIQHVDFKKYADIIVNLQMNNEYYWLIKHFDDATMDHIRNHFDRDSGNEFMKRFTQLNDEILRLKEEHVAPEDDRVLDLAKKFWEMVIEFTDGDMTLLPNLMKFENMNDDQDWVRKQKNVNEYIQIAMERYFKISGINPFDEVTK